MHFPILFPPKSHLAPLQEHLSDVFLRHRTQARAGAAGAAGAAARLAALLAAALDGAALGGARGGEGAAPW